MSTQNFPLQPLNGGQGKANTDPGYLQEPLEASTQAGTKVQCWKDWPWKRILTTVTNLLGYVSLYTGISMIAPFYPIVVSAALFSLASFPGSHQLARLCSHCPSVFIVVLHVCHNFGNPTGWG